MTEPFDVFADGVGLFPACSRSAVVSFGISFGVVNQTDCHWASFPARPCQMNRRVTFTNKFRSSKSVLRVATLKCGRRQQGQWEHVRLSKKPNTCGRCHTIGHQFVRENFTILKQRGALVPSQPSAIQSLGTMPCRRCWIAARYTEYHGYFRKRFLNDYVLEKDEPLLSSTKFKEFGILFSRIEI